MEIVDKAFDRSSDRNLSSFLSKLELSCSMFWFGHELVRSRWLTSS